MRIMSTFHALVVLIVVLTFSTSFATLAQQNPVLTEVSKTAAAQNASAVVLEAKAAAERDASKDTNELLWGCIGGTLPFAFSNAFMGGLMMLSSEGRTAYHLDENETRVFGFVVLALGASCIGIVGWGIFAERPPPPHRLIGKSPEYVESYLNAYKRKMRLLRGTSAVAGSGVACLSVFALVAVVPY